MAKSFKELRAKMSPEARARAEQKTQELLREILLTEAPTACENIQESEGRPPPSHQEQDHNYKN
jgi:hypothetical protein